jgi:hypothetical protein
MNNAHPDGRPGDDVLFVARLPPRPVTEGLQANHQDTTMAQARNKGEPTVTGRIVGGLIKAVKVMVNIGLKVISTPRPIAIIKGRASSAGRAKGLTIQRDEKIQAAQASRSRACGATTSRRTARPSGPRHAAQPGPAARWVASRSGGLVPMGRDTANRAEASAATARSTIIKINPVLNYSNSKAFGFFHDHESCSRLKISFKLVEERCVNLASNLG